MQRGLAWALVALGALVFVLFSGIGLMLGALNQFHWALVAVPGSVLLLTMLAFLKARTPIDNDRFAELKAQMDSDLRALREAAK